MQTPSDAQTAYWETKLKGYNLGTERGRPEWLSYGHVINDLDYDGRLTYTAKDVEDKAEWPISL